MALPLAASVPRVLYTCTLYGISCLNGFHIFLKTAESLLSPADFTQESNIQKDNSGVSWGSRHRLGLEFSPQSSLRSIQVSREKSHLSDTAPCPTGRVCHSLCSCHVGVQMGSPWCCTKQRSTAQITWAGNGHCQDQGAGWGLPGTHPRGE